MWKWITDLLWRMFTKNKCPWCGMVDPLAEWWRDENVNCCRKCGRIV
jgi:Zn ribbon nucleic-acid-binding protein